MAGLALVVADLPEMAPIVSHFALGSTYRGLPGVIASVVNELDIEVVNGYRAAARRAATELCWEAESHKLTRLVEDALNR